MVSYIEYAHYGTTPASNMSLVWAEIVKYRMELLKHAYSNMHSNKLELCGVLLGL